MPLKHSADAEKRAMTQILIDQVLLSSLAPYIVWYIPTSDYIQRWMEKVLINLITSDFVFEIKSNEFGIF